MKNRVIVFGFLLIAALWGCEPNEGMEGNSHASLPPDHGILLVKFPKPHFNYVPDTGIHRVSLGLAYTLDSLYRGEYFKKVNVSDYLEEYEILLPEGEYVWEAVITCSCGADTCLSGGFPGGQYGMKHDFDLFVITIGQTTTIQTNFDL